MRNSIHLFSFLSKLYPQHWRLELTTLRSSITFSTKRASQGPLHLFKFAFFWIVGVWVPLPVYWLFRFPILWAICPSHGTDLCWRSSSESEFRGSHEYIPWSIRFTKYPLISLKPGRQYAQTCFFIHILFKWGDLGSVFANPSALLPWKVSAGHRLPPSPTSCSQGVIDTSSVVLALT